MQHIFSAAVLALAGLTACGAISGLDEFHAAPPQPAAADRGCTVHADCTQAGADFCLSASQRCVSLKSPDCTNVTGPATANDAILIGSMFSTSGSQAAVNIARQRSVMLAVSEINGMGGVPRADKTGQPRPLVLVSCDESKDAVRAATHLAEDLQIPAIIGPNNSQDQLDIAMKVTVAAGTVTISPTAVAESIAELRDNDLSWQMVPTDVQRGPLLIHELNTLERVLRARLGRDLKLGMIFRDDALGIGTRASLVDLVWNGKPLSAAGNLGTRVRIDAYDASETSHADMIAAHVAFAPDVVVLVGAGDAVSGVMEPLEAAWGAPPRPQYVLIDSTKVPELLALVGRNPELRTRVRGTGIAPGPDSEPVLQSFRIAYQARYPDDLQSTSSGLGASYDATYAVALAMVAGGGTSGAEIARGLRKLGRGQGLPLGPTNILSAFRRFDAGESIAAIGTFSQLAWDDRGAISAGRIEIWCVELVEGAPAYTSSGLSADIPDQTLHGENRVCGLMGAAMAPLTTGMPGMSTTPAMQPSATGGTRDAGAEPDAGSEPEPPVQVDAGTQPDAGSAAPPTRRIPCGGARCDRNAGEYCCIEPVPNAPPNVSQFSCQTEDRQCTAHLRCTSDRECDHGQICCINPQRESYCRAAAGCSPGDQHLACDTGRDCAEGQVCCAESGDFRALRATTCRSSCSEVGSAYPNMLCEAQNQCPPSSRCVQSPALPSVGICL